MRERTQRFDPRQIMHGHSFEIFHYQDAVPTEVDMHHHDFYEVYFFLSGNVEYRVEGRLYQLEPGDLLLISPLEFHQSIVRPDTAPYERVVLWINKAYLEQFSGEVSLTRCFDTALPTHTNLLRPTPAQKADLVVRFGELLQESYGSDYGHNLSAIGQLLQLMVHINRMALRLPSPAPAREQSSPLISKVLSYIGEHYDQELSLESLAQQFYVSKYHLSHEFSRIVGTSVYRYITLKRLLIARQMLAGGVAPGVVYANCGFRDYANFYRAFRAQYGVSPRDFSAGER